MTATSLGAGWDLFPFGEPRPDLAFSGAWGSKDMGELWNVFLSQRKFQPKKTQLGPACERVVLGG